MKCQHSWEEVGRLSEQINTDSYSSLPNTKLLRSLWNGKIYIIRICNKCFDLQYKSLGSSWKPFNQDIAKKFSSVNVFEKEDCSKCFAKYYCSGGCAANSYNITGDLKKNVDISCEMERKRVELSIALALDK